jgi:D-glucuronyl C5-epimerase C-terminus
MSLLRRLALGFPRDWTHRRGWSLDAIREPGAAPYFIEWDPGSGVYGEDFTTAPRGAEGELLFGDQGSIHPIRMAQFALHRYSIWQATGDAEARADFFAQAQWFRDRGDDGPIPGLYVFDFPWDKYGAGSGWTSAMAQGEAISVLLRAEHHEPGSGFGDAARRAAQPFRAEIGEGGVVWRSGHDVFFEEVANSSAPHILNGCIFALWGVWELWQRTGEAWLGELVQQCVETLGRWLALYDTGWWSLYSLMRSASGQPHLATLKYHEFHIAQLQVLAAMFSEPMFKATAARWAEYEHRPSSRRRLIRTTLQSLPERLLGRDCVAGGAKVAV